MLIGVGWSIENDDKFNEKQSTLVLARECFTCKYKAKQLVVDRI